MKVWVHSQTGSGGVGTDRASGYHFQGSIPRGYGRAVRAEGEDLGPVQGPETRCWVPCRSQTCMTGAAGGKAEQGGDRVPLGKRSQCRMHSTEQCSPLHI